MSRQIAKPLKTMLLIAIPSIILFIIMYLLTTHSSKAAFDNFMKANLGYTDKWSKTFGSAWLVSVADDVSDLSAQINFILNVGFVSVFLIYLRENRRLMEFLFTLIGAAIILFITKFFMNATGPENILDIFFGGELGFPRGHALMSLVLYTTLAKYSGIKLKHTSARYVVYAFAAVIIFLIDISRLFTSHTLTEVIAGWSAGLFWISIVNYFFSKQSGQLKHFQYYYYND